MSCFFGKGNELQGSIKCGEFLDQLRTPLRGIVFPSILGILPILLAMLKLSNTMYTTFCIAILISFSAFRKT